MSMQNVLFLYKFDAVCVCVCVCVSVSISNSSSDLGKKVPGNLEWSNVGPNEGKEPKNMTQAPNLIGTICTDEI